MATKTDYTHKVPDLVEELREKTLSEAEAERSITRFDYSGVGFGYCFKSSFPKNIEQAKKATATPELDRIEKLAAKMG